MVALLITWIALARLLAVEKRWAKEGAVSGLSVPQREPYTGGPLQQEALPNVVLSEMPKLPSDLGRVAPYGNSGYYLNPTGLAKELGCL